MALTIAWTAPYNRKSQHIIEERTTASVTAALHQNIASQPRRKSQNHRLQIKTGTPPLSQTDNERLFKTKLAIIQTG